MKSFFNDITFAYPEFFWALLLVPVLIAYYIWKNNLSNGELKFSTLNSFYGINQSPKVYLRHSLFVLRLMALSLLIVAIARPQSRSSWKNVSAEGIDIILTMDISASMLAQDFKPNRLAVSKEVAIDFIDSRPNDRIGLVIFSGESFTQCPLTTDHAVLKNLFAAIRPGIITDGTAIGMGLANSVNRIKNSNAKSKVIILITDGVNNAGSIAPQTAAEIAKTFGVRVYTIGAGTRGKALSPVSIYPNGEYEYDYVDVKIDDEGLTRISEMTGGKYFRATDKEKLKNIYSEIDKLEKTIINEKSFSNKSERFFPFAIAAAILLLTEAVLKFTFFRKTT